jgi:hypothetical protein
MKQFSIRDLLLLVLIVAIGLGWWVDRRSRAALSPARYQIQVVEGHAFVLDTSTGQVWEKWLHPSGGSTSPGFLQPKTPPAP